MRVKGIWVRKVDIRLPGKGNSNSHGARPIHLIMTMIKWFRTSELSINSSLSAPRLLRVQGFGLWGSKVESLGLRGLGLEV